MQALTLPEFKELAGHAPNVAVFEEIPAAGLTPAIIYNTLRDMYNENGVIWEDACAESSHRYAYICFNIIDALTIVDNSEVALVTALRNKLSLHSCTTRANMRHLITSAMGFISYEATSSFANIPTALNKDYTTPVCLFYLYALNVTFDYVKQKVLVSIIVNAKTSENYYQAKEKIQSIINRLIHADRDLPTNVCQESYKHSPIIVEPSDSDFINQVLRAKDYIRSGDAFQIVLSRAFKCTYSAPSIAIYNILRQLNPSPFMFYFPTAANTIIAASPERLVSVYNKIVSVNPIAGTRKRDATSCDAAISADLLSDAKELAEHMMLVDLARNDVGKVSKPGSVQVKDLLKIRHYSHVSHITTTVIGELQDQYDALDALQATFPAGTLSGAPKIRAMQIITELEQIQRGLYGGAMCRFDLANNFDSSIAIRMAVLQDGVATVRAGAGIVFDSDPINEAQETYHKARSVLAAII